MIVSRVRNGYTFLLSVLFIGGIAVTVSGTMLLLSWLTLHTGETLARSAKAFELAMTCAEHGLLELFEDGNYGGYEELVLGNETCSVLPVGGAGNENRTLCTEGRSGDTTRRLEIVVQRLLPSIRIYSWQEVDIFTFCSFE